MEEFTGETCVIGLASDERIWKICYAVNQALGLNLREIGTSDKESPVVLQLDRSHELWADPGSESDPDAHFYYEDCDSYSRLEFALFEINTARVPKEVRAFRYFLLIRGTEELIPAKEFSSQLTASPQIRSAVDLSHIKQIQSLLN